MKYEKEILEKLKDTPYVLEDLTLDEIQRLQEEIEVEKQGGTVLDGVLFSKPKYVRKSEGNN